MRICYIDAFSGISGDMFLGALLDCGVSLPRLREGLACLELSNFSIRRRRVENHGISATRLIVTVPRRESRRSLEDILAILERSRLEEGIRQAATSVFQRIAKAEAKVHGEKVKDVHFHEVGATDALVDIVGTLLALEMLEVEGVYSTALPLGTGFAETTHGLMPVPAPATLELLKDYPVVKTEREGELTTPTGAALVSTLSHGTTPPSPFSVLQVGYGAGRRISADFPNLVRVILGEVDAGVEGDHVYLIETNIDDMEPQLIPNLQEGVIRAGAIDVYRLPVQMKKDRPGTLLQALVDSRAFDQVVEVIFRESTTIGLRYWEVSRIKLRRSIEVVDTALGPVHFKVVHLPWGGTRRKPEYEDCLRISEETGLPLPEVVGKIEGEIGGRS